MGYVESTLLKDEHVVFKTSLHWIIFVPSIVFLVIAGVLYYGGASSVGNVVLLIALVLGVTEYGVYKNSEFAVTNKRVVIKIGILRRRTLETLLQKIEAIAVEQGISARIFGFGTIVVIGTGGTKEPFKRIRAPMEFRRAVQSESS